MKTLYYNGTVYDGSQMAEAFIVEDGHFIFCGSNHEAEKYGYDEKTDLKGSLSAPGSMIPICICLTLDSH